MRLFVAKELEENLKNCGSYVRSKLWTFMGAGTISKLQYSQDRLSAETAEESKYYKLRDGRAAKTAEVRRRYRPAMNFRDY